MVVTTTSDGNSSDTTDQKLRDGMKRIVLSLKQIVVRSFQEYGWDGLVAGLGI